MVMLRIVYRVSCTGRKIKGGRVGEQVTSLQWAFDVKHEERAEALGT